MQYKDYYSILGVDKGASTDDIKKAYRKLVKKYHPDSGDSPDKSKEKFQEISEAYEVLKDDEKRKKYDAFGSNANFRGGADFDPSQYGYSASYGGGGDFSDFFNMIFGSGFGGARNSGGAYSYSFGGGGNPFGGYATQPQMMEAEAEISVYEAYHGTQRALNLNGRQINVKIPAGIKSGEKVRMKSENLQIKIKVKDDDIYKLTDSGLVMNVGIEPYRAVLGGKANFTAIDGSNISLNIKPGTSAGTKLKIPRKGFKDRKGNVGDLIILLYITAPKNPSQQEIDLYKEIQKLHEV